MGAAGDCPPRVSRSPGSGGRDVFGALRRAALLPFTPGASRTFILLPCSACEAAHMSIDYTTLANAFAEQQITLHVLLSTDIRVSKQRNRLLGKPSSATPQTAR